MKYFGSGCFTGPGSKTEDIAFGAMMHNVEPQQIIYELNEAIKNGAEGGEVAHLSGFFLLFINLINFGAINHIV